MPLAHWNDTFLAALDWSNLAFQQMFWNATNERHKAVSNGDIYPGVGALLAGMDVQGGSATNFTIYFLQLSCDEPFFLNPNLVYDGNTLIATFPTYHFADVRTATGQDPLGFTIKSPRSIHTTADSADYDANPAVAGQYAELRGSGAPGGGGYGQIYRCVAPGNWVQEGDLSKHADVLVSTNASPNRATLTLGPSADHFGGQYIGPWLFNEIRDYLNQLVWTQFGDTPGVAGPAPYRGSLVYKYKRYDSAAYATLAAAKADAVAGYPGVAASVGSQPNGNTYASPAGLLGFMSALANNGGATPYTASLFGFEFDFTDLSWASVKRDLEYYIFTDFDPAPNVYDVQGYLNLVQGQYKRMHIESGVIGTVTYTFNNVNTLPAWGTAIGSGSGDFFGFGYVACAVITKYDVVDGFAYTTLTV